MSLNEANFSPYVWGNALCTRVTNRWRRGEFGHEMRPRVGHGGKIGELTGAWRFYVQVRPGTANQASKDTVLTVSYAFRELTDRCHQEEGRLESHPPRSITATPHQPTCQQRGSVSYDRHDAVRVRISLNILTYLVQYNVNIDILVPGIVYTSAGTINMFYVRRCDRIKNSQNDAFSTSHFIQQ